MDKGYFISAFKYSLENSDWLEDTQTDHLLNLLDDERGMRDFDEFLTVIDKAPSLKNLPPKVDEDVKSLLDSSSLLHAMDTLIGITTLRGPVYKKEAARLSLEKMADKGFPSAQANFARLLLNEGEEKKQISFLERANKIFNELKKNPYASPVELDMANYYSKECDDFLKAENAQQNFVKKMKEKEIACEKTHLEHSFIKKSPNPNNFYAEARKRLKGRE